LNILHAGCFVKQETFDDDLLDLKLVSHQLILDMLKAVKVSSAAFPSLHSVIVLPGPISLSMTTMTKSWKTDLTPFRHGVAISGRHTLSNCVLTKNSKVGRSILWLQFSNGWLVG